MEEKVICEQGNENWTGKPDPLQALSGVQISAQQAAAFKANVERAKREREFKPTLGALFPSLGTNSIPRRPIKVKK